jgi:hypothetical protein
VSGGPKDEAPPNPPRPGRELARAPAELRSGRYTPPRGVNPPRPPPKLPPRPPRGVPRNDIVYTICVVQSVCGVRPVAAKVREEFFAWEEAANRRNVAPTVPSAATPPNASAKPWWAVARATQSKIVT